MKRLFKSIRWRLQAWHALLLLLVLLGFGFKSYSLARESHFGVIDRALLRHSVIALAAIPDPNERKPVRRALRKAFVERWQLDLRQPPENSSTDGDTNADTALSNRPSARDLAGEIAPILARSEQMGYYYVYWRADGSVWLHSGNLPGVISQPETDKVPRFHTRMRGGLRELFITVPNGTQLLVGCSVAADLASLHHLAFRLGLTGAVIMVLGLAGGWWLSSRMIRPIQEISATAAKIASGNLAERINLSDTDSELGRLAGVFNASFDRVEAAFNQLHATLNRQVQFTADASHELRTPISVVLAESNSALARERTTAEYQEALESCRHAARRMHQLTDSLLTLAGLDCGEHSGKRELCDLQTVAQDAIKLLRPLADEHGVVIHSQMDAAPCLGDAGQLGQVVTNLINNAIQYNRPGGEVRVRVTSEWRRTVLHVIDTGQGIAAEDVPRIFDRFYRADKSRSRANGHVGLGLSIAKAIVDAHGGTIHVTSEAGAGSIFTVTLKRAETVAT